MLNRPNFRFEEAVLILIYKLERIIHHHDKKIEHCMPVLVTTVVNKGWTCRSALPFCTGLYHEKLSLSRLKRNRGWGFPTAFSWIVQDLIGIIQIAIWKAWKTQWIETCIMNHEVTKQHGTSDACNIQMKTEIKLFGSTTFPHASTMCVAIKCAILLLNSMCACAQLTLPTHHVQHKTIRTIFTMMNRNHCARYTWFRMHMEAHVFEMPTYFKPCSFIQWTWPINVSTCPTQDLKNLHKWLLARFPPALVTGWLWRLCDGRSPWTSCNKFIHHPSPWNHYP